MNRYYWSFDKDEEIWNHSEERIEDCIEEAKLNNWRGCKSVFIGELEDYIPVIDAINIIEELQEEAYNECGECSETWLDAINHKQTESLEERLNDALQKWLEETNNQPNFGKVTKIKCYDLETGKEIK